MLQQAEANHPKLRGSQAEIAAATGKRISKQGAFDPVFFAGHEYLRYNSTSTRGKALTTSMNDVGLELPFRSGVKVFAATRLNLGSPKSPVSSTGNTGEWNLGIKAPLRRGFGINDKSAQEQQALLGEPLSVQNFATVRLDVLREAALAYWDWVAAGQKATVASDLLRIAEVRAAQIKARFERGDLPEVDTIEANQEVARRQGALVKAERDRQKAAFKLALYLWGEGTNRLPPADQTPATFPTTTDIPPEAVEAGGNRAVSLRPEVQVVRLQQQSVRVDEALAENDRQPALDLVFNPGLDSGTKAIGETFKWGLVFSVPLYLREATGRRTEARFKQEKLRQEETLLLGRIQVEVRDAANAVDTARQRIVIAEQEVALAVRLEEAERQRFDLGEGTLFLVNQRERATAEARQRLIDVQAEYQQAVAAFRAATMQL
ncbi:MAG: TolC family protein [Capsulimonadales bacterium]|nr:TolC family protein [Capsulimonadales bacterium]